MPNPCWGKLIFVRLYGCLFTEILICTFKPIIIKKCSSPNPCHQELVFHHQPFSLQFHRYSALHIGHRIQTLDLSGLPTKPRQSWDSAANVGGSSDHEVGGFQVSKFIQEAMTRILFFRSFVSFLSSQTI